MSVRNRTSADFGKASSRMLLKVNTVNAKERTLWRSLDENSFPSPSGKDGAAHTQHRYRPDPTELGII